MSQIRFGMIGAGMIALHAAPDINKHASAKVVAAYDPSAKRLKDLCEKNDIAKACTSAEQLLEDASIDAVYIAVPNKFHAPLAIQALRAGKHVILDKPFALSSAEAEAVLDAARASGKMFTLGMNQRFAEDHQKIKSLVDRGVLGDIYHAKAYWVRRAGIPGMGTWFGHKPLAGGGGLLDIGVHMLDLCLYTLGNFEPESVTGVTYSKFGHRGLGKGGWGISDDEGLPFDVDDFAMALIKMKNGTSISLEAGWACHMEHPNRHNLELYGTEAGATVVPPKVFRYCDIGDYQVIENVKADIKYPHKNRFHNFINALLGKEELCTTWEQSLTVQRILDAIYESAHTGREVRIEEAVAV